MILKFKQTLTPIVGNTLITTENFESICSRLVEHYRDQIVGYSDRACLINLDSDNPILGWSVFVRFNIGTKEVTDNGDIIYPITLSTFDVGYDRNLFLSLTNHYGEMIKFDRFINVCIGYADIDACALRPLSATLSPKYKYSKN